MQRPSVIATAGLVYVSEGQLLLVRPARETAFYLPGGKIEAGETPVEALRREVREELSVELDPDTIAPVGTVQADAWGFDDGTQVAMSCFAANLLGEPSPAGEIAEMGWFTSRSYTAAGTSAPAVRLLFDRLVRRRVCL